MNLPRKILLIALLLASPVASYAATEADIDKMTTYATVLGRAIGCGINTDSAMKRVGRWMDKTFPPGSRDQQIYLPIFMEGVKHHAEQQRAGSSPDSCSELRKTFNTFPWP